MTVEQIAERIAPLMTAGIIKALVDALKECGTGHAHYETPHTVEGGEFQTVHGPVVIDGGPCKCRWCKARRLVDDIEAKAKR